MANPARRTGAKGGHEELQEQFSSLDWMLDSSHVNVGLWNDFDGRRFGTEEQGFHDQEDLPQQSSAPDSSFPVSHANVDLLKGSDLRRTFRAQEQGLDNRGAGIKGHLDTNRVDSWDSLLGVSEPFYDLRQDASIESIHDDPLSWTIGSAACFTNSFNEQPTDRWRPSIFDESFYNPAGPQAPRADYGDYLHDFGMGYGYPYFSNRTSQTRPELVYKQLDHGSVATDSRARYNPATIPDNHYNASGKHSEKQHADTLPSQLELSPQEMSIWNQALNPCDPISSLEGPRPEASPTKPSAISTEGPFFCQRCKYPRCYKLEANLRRHTAASHPTRKVWITVDISPFRKFLANCEACRTGTRYGAWEHAALHLRRVHFPNRIIWTWDLMKWMRELEEDINTEHQVSQWAVPKIRVLDSGLDIADIHSEDDLTQLHRGRRTALPVNAPSLSPNSDQKKQSAHQETGRSTAHNGCPGTFDDQLLTRHPKRQKTASSHWSADSGYMSDSTTHSNQLKGADTSHWLKPGADENWLTLKDEPLDPAMCLIPFLPIDESDDYDESRAKKEPSEAPKADTKRSRKSECKGLHKSEHSAKKHLGQSQHSNEPYNSKQKWQFSFYSPPTMETTLKDFAPEFIVDIDIGKKLANSKLRKADYTKDNVCSMKAEPNSIDASSQTAAPEQVLITFDTGSTHQKYNNTLPLPFGHPKSRQWTAMLPSIKACTRDIMGKGNGGALELFLVNGEPTICITCWDPLKLNLALVRSCMEPLGLRINVTKGKIRKSAGDEHDGLGSAVHPVQSQCEVPPVHGHYMQRPTCGASLGTADGPLKDGKVSLGGYVKVKHLDRLDWNYYAMTVHHILVSDDQNELPSSITGNDEDEEIAEPGYDYSPGVCDGVYDVGDGPGGRVAFSCPAVPDTQSLVSRLEDRRLMRCANEDYAAIDNLDNLNGLLNKVCTSGNTMFGNAAWSSGLCLDQDVEMDWLLIGHLPTDRIGCNEPGDVTGYMEGNHGDPKSKACWTPSAYVDDSAFNILMNPSARWWEHASSAGGYLSRVFGRGSETGLADGFLSPHPSIFFDETYGPYDAWAFTPRCPYGLGDSGDSGTWIFTSEGKLLGQIISYNRARHITYFTPICRVFDHIKRITGATDVELLTPEDVKQNPRVAPRSAGGLLSPEEELYNCSTSMATNIQASVESSTARKRFVTPPRTSTYISQPLPFPSYPVRGYTAGLPTPGSMQASPTSD